MPAPAPYRLYDPSRHAPPRLYDPSRHAPPRDGRLFSFGPAHTKSRRTRGRTRGETATPVADASQPTGPTTRCSTTAGKPPRVCEHAGESKIECRRTGGGGRVRGHSPGAKGAPSPGSGGSTTDCSVARQRAATR